jgi:quinohemoprotein ethanol dehydrogenase
MQIRRAVPLLLIAVAIAGAQQPRRVDDAALKDAAKTGEEWISYNLGWSEQRFSALNQINATNVSRLGLAWSSEIPSAPGRPQTRQEGTPLVYNGVIYSIAPWSVVYAVDARTGKQIWKQDPDVNQQVWQSRVCCGVVNRGIALYQGKIIAPVIDGRLRALDAETGKVVWETRVSPENMAYTITMAPRVIKGGKIIIGVSGGEYAVRGFFSAIDAETGNEAWKFYTVPGDPSKPFENPALADAAKTWSGEWWKTGGGAPVWNGMAYDPDSDTVYVGTGQPGPWTEVSRGPGDNLYSDCILAVRGATGQLVWYYQEVPGDDWDYDSIADLMLADLKINGATRKVIMHAPKDGFFYVLDRRTGELLSADPWVTITWASGVNLKTGRPTVNPEARYGKEGASVMPGPGGGHVWPPWSFSPATGLVYIPSTIGGAYSYVADPNFKPSNTDIGAAGRGQMNMGTGFAGGGRGGGGRAAAPGTVPGTPPGVDTAAAPAAQAAPPPQPPPTIPAIGPTVERSANVLIAWDPIAQMEKWRGLAAGFNQGGTVATAGNLVFSSVNTRLLAYRADTGEQVLDVTTGLSQMGPPMTFMLDGKQYVSIAGGPPAAPGGGGRGGPGGAPPGVVAPPAPGAPVTPAPPSMLLTFVLDGKAHLPGK